MIIAKITNNAVETLADYREFFPNTSFPTSGPTAEFLTENGFMSVTMFKPYDAATQKLEPVAPYIENDTVFTVNAVALSAEELAAKAAATMTSYVSAVQAHLDSVAKQKNYDSILSACTYATSPNTKFAAEGQACIVWRDAVWTACYAILENITAGIRTAPTITELIAELPVITWPVV